MRTVVQETGADVDEVSVIDWRSEFVPAIIRTTHDVGCVSLSREPFWFAARYEFGKRRLTFRVLDHIGIRFHSFEYVFKRPRQKATMRSWFPGYIFLNFDPKRDLWHQVRRIPGIIQILEYSLGVPAPIDDEVMADILTRCPRNLAPPLADSSLKPGIVVRVKSGVFAGQEGVVQSSDRKTAVVTTWMFGRPVLSRLPTAYLETVG